MASSKVMPSTSSAPNSDLPHQLSPFPLPPPPPPLLLPDPPAISTTTISAPSTAMDDFLKNIYGDSSSSHSAPHIAAGDEIPARGIVAANGMDEVWKEAEMTLEDFLTRASGAVRDDEMRIPAVPSVSAPPPSQCFGTSSMISGGFGVVPGVAVVGNGQFQSSLTTPEGFANGGAISGGGGGGRSKRRPIDEPPVDKATQQKQRRMIKNRESAARSRERKQAYTVELEGTVAQLEEENARLQDEEAQGTRERFKQLMQNVIPVTEKRKPQRPLRRVNSMVW